MVRLHACLQAYARACVGECITSDHEKRGTMIDGERERETERQKQKEREGERKGERENKINLEEKNTK